jgi:hypothetical protein
MTIEQIHWLALATMIAAAPALGLGALRAQTAEQPVAREKSPPGDIPDSQVFVTYRSPRHRHVNGLRSGGGLFDRHADSARPSLSPPSLSA